jgi:hypothetical protein
MSKKIGSEVKHLRRIMMSLTDIRFCKSLISEINNIFTDSPIYRATEEAIIISYARPFSGNDSKSTNSSGDLRQKGFKRTFSEHQLKVHERVSFKLRNSIVAHSDSASYGVSFSICETDGGRFLFPRQRRIEQLLSESDLKVLLENCIIIEAWLFEEQNRVKNALPVGSY